MTGRKGYNAELDVLRFLFAMVIAWFHLVHFTGTDFNLSLPLGGGLSIHLPGGYIVTDFFFIVSGALMARHAQKKAGTAMSASEPLSYCFGKYRGMLGIFFTSLVTALVLDKWVVGINLLERSGNALDAVWEVLGLHMSGVGNGYLISDPDWYLSALLLGCLLLYPVCRKHPECTMSYLGPVGAVFIFGYLIKTYGHLCVNFGDFRLVYPAVLRAVGGLLLGCFVWKGAQELAALKLTGFGRWCVTVLEVLCVAAVWALMSTRKFTRDDLTALLALTALCVLVMSGQSSLGTHLNERLARFLGSMSQAMFFSHYIVYQYFKKNPLSTPNKTFAAFTGCVLLMALAVHLVSKLVTMLARWIAQRLKPLFIA